MTSQTPQKPLRLLSLDGGGVRGLATLLILDNLTRRIDPKNPPKPCDCFDLIGGTSTGGLIAIMLGHLEMDVQSCIDAYIQLSSRIFRKKLKSWRFISSALKKLRVKEKFDSAELEEAIKEIIERQGKEKDLMLRNETNPDPKCKVFVCVTRSENARNTCFRSYNSTRGNNPNCKTWEAGRATSAATTFFDPITIGPFGATYVDGATGVNNPVNEVLAEARDIWPDLNQRLRCLVSIGTGQSNFSKFGDNLIQVVKTLKNIATDTERTAERFLVAHRDLKETHRYFRFNVIRGLEEIGLEENKKIGEMSAATDAYLETEGVRIEMEDCVKSMTDISTYMPLQLGPTIFDINYEFKEEYEKIRSWLSPPNYQSDYENIKDQRETNTCQWILENDQFKNWNNGPSKFLWIHGGPGCGKSVIASTIVETIEAENSTEPGQNHLGYAFCDKRDESKQSPLALMKILVWQIISRQDLRPDQKQITINKWRATANPKTLSNPSLGSIESLSPRVIFTLFEELLMSYTSCKIVLDGLDECENPENILKWLTNLTKTSPHIRLLLVSQNVSPISEVLDGNLSTIQITPDNTRADLVQYVDTNLQRVLGQRQDVYPKIRELLLGNAEGMFLWVKLAIAQLKAAKRSICPTEARLLDSIHRLPKKIDVLFVYILERMLKDDENSSEAEKISFKQEIFRALGCVLGSFRPLKIDELQVALGFSFPETNEPPAIDPISSDKESVTEFQEKLLSLCAPILSVQQDGTVTFVHSSFQIFMETTARHHPVFQPQLQEATAIHRMLAIASIRYLQSEVFADFVHFTEKYGENTLDDLFPFKQYATQYWWLHLIESPPCTEDNTQQLSKRLMDFVKSPQAITWLESALYRKRTTALEPLALGDCIHLQSKVSEWLGPSGPQDWVYQLVHEGVRKRKTKIGEEHLDTLRAMASLATAYSAYSRFDEAVELELKVLEARKEVLGERHLDTLEAMGNLAATYNLTGRFKEAEELELQVLERREELLGKEHPYTLVAMGNLAVTYSNRGLLKDSEELELRVLKLRKKVLGEEHLDTLRGMSNLAGIYVADGRLEEAQNLEERILDIQNTTLGAEHPETLYTMENLAVTYFNTGRVKEAEEITMRVLESMTKVFGKEHLRTMQVKGGLAKMYRRYGKLKEAEELCMQVLQRRMEALGKDHPDTLYAIEDLASTYYSYGRLEEAKELSIQVIEARKKLLGQDHRLTLRITGDLAAVYCRLGLLKESEELALQVLDAERKLLGEDHLGTLQTMANLAAIYNKSGRLSEAEELEIQVLEARKRLLGEDHMDTVQAMGNLAVTYDSLGRLNEAQGLMIQVLDARKRIFGEENPDTLRTMENLSVTYQKTLRLGEAEKLGIQVLGARQRLLGDEHPETLKAMENLAVTYESLGRLIEAQGLMIQILDTRKKLLGEDHLDTLQTMESLAAAYKDSRQLREAEKLELQVLEVRKRVLGIDHPKTLSVMRSLAMTYQMGGLWKEAEELKSQILEAQIGSECKVA